jgi:hypothetical protein
VPSCRRRVADDDDDDVPAAVQVREVPGEQSRGTQPCAAAHLIRRGQRFRETVPVVG